MRKAHALAALLVAAMLGLAACGNDDNGGGGAGSATTKPAASADISNAEVVATTDAGHQPLDGAPSPDGTVIYFTAVGEPSAAVYSVPAAGGATTTLAEGAPLAKPSGVAVATDGSRLFVADQQAQPVGGAAGAVLTIPASGGAAPTLLAGTEGRSPRGLDVAKQEGADVVYFTGTDPASGAPGLFRVPAAGGTAATVAEGSPFVAPDSVVVTKAGVAYVTDQGAGEGQGILFRVSNGTVTPVLAGVHLGNPAGVTVAQDDATVLVSSIETSTGSDQVLFFDVATGKTSATTKVIGENKNSSGGLHRAYASPVMAWADVLRPGRIYRVDP